MKTSRRFFPIRRLAWRTGLAFSLLASVQGATASESVIDSFAYTNPQAAEAAWRPMPGSPAVDPASLDGAAALRFRCPFAGTTIERASWDRAVNLDLTNCRGIEFQVFCRDASPVAYFSIYFQSGNGWYAATFYPESSTAWNHLTIDKAETRTEGQPAGWGQIRTIRISAWRAQDVDTQFHLRDLRKRGVLGEDTRVAIVRGESAAHRSESEARAVEQYAEGIAGALRALGVGASMISDVELTAQRLEPAAVAVLPYNPGLPEQAATALAHYVRQGGKVLVFYTPPEPLLPLLGIAGCRHLKASPAGQFSSIRFPPGTVAGAPKQVNQRSWNITSCRPVPGVGRVLAEWWNDEEQRSGHPAVVGSTNGLLVTHVLLQDDPEHQRRMLLALLGHLAPEIWQQAADASIATIGAIGSFDSFAAATQHLQHQGVTRPEVASALAAAAAERNRAIASASNRNFAEALDAAQAAREKLTEAFCRAQTAQPGEFRAFWCHSAFGVNGMTWDEAIRRLAENGFTAILPNMLWGGVAYYDSQSLPVAADVARRGDQIAECLAACRRHALQVHVWKVNWNLGHAAPKAFIERMRQAARLQASAGGQQENWLCPSHPENQQLEIHSMVEVARKYAVDGIHFDYIRYPGNDHCYCAGCRERFAQVASTPVASWPGDVRQPGPLRDQWLEWRRSHITAVVKTVSEQARAVRPGLKLSAAVFRNWPVDRDTVGQDWKTWCDAGYLDFVCPMDYTPSTRNFENMLAPQLKWAGQVPCYPGIGLSASSSDFGIDRLIEQIQITRRLRTGGFVIFNYGVRESREILPLLGLGITKP